MMGFKAEQVLPGVWHIADCMGVCMTLLAGTHRALLVDTGYGLQDVKAFVRTLTDLPLQVLLTHAHHDHILGARWFERTGMLQADLADFAQYTSLSQRSRVQEQAQAKGLKPPDDFLTAPIPQPQSMEPCVIELGGLTAQIIVCPGHTPGSAVVYVPQRQLLLTGDDWNPCTWLFFEQALPVETYRAHMKQVQKLPFQSVLCSHQPMLFERKKLDDFLDGLTDECLRSAHPVNMGRAVDTREVYPAEGQNLVFDWGKSNLLQKEKSI